LFLTASLFSGHRQSASSASQSDLHARPQQQQSQLQDPIHASGSSKNLLSSPEIIKSVSRTLTPPVSPFSRGATVKSELTQQQQLISDPVLDGNYRSNKASSPRTTALSSTDMMLSTAKAAAAAVAMNGGTSPGSLVVSPASASSATKPPIFPNFADNTNAAATGGSSGSGSGGGTLKVTLRKNAETVASPAFLRKSSDVEEQVPAFVKEFAGVVRRRSSGAGAAFNPNETAPPKPSSSPSDSPPRPQSAILPQTPVPSARRRSDFMARYEELASRAQVAMRMADAAIEGAAVAGADANEDPPDVEFNEEEVLRTCQDFIKDYDKSKQRRSLTFDQQTPLPVPRPRDSLRKTLAEQQSLSVNSSPSRLNRARVVNGPTVMHAPPVPSVRNRSSSLTLLDKRSPPKSPIPMSSMPPSAFASQHGEDSGFHSILHPRPILKKSSEDLSTLVGDFDSTYSSAAATKVFKPIPILKHKDPSSAAMDASSTGGILKKKPPTSSFMSSAVASEETTTSSMKPEHVRIRSPSPTDNNNPRYNLLLSRIYIMMSSIIN
jgi:hypothetical protein